MNWTLLAPILGIIFFYALVFWVGVWGSRSIGKRETTSDLFLTSRQMPLWVGVFTMTACWVGGGYINGTAEATYTSGLLWAQAPWGYALSLVVGGMFFVKRMYQGGYTTFLDPFERRLGKEVTAALFLVALTGEIFWSSAILTALGTTMSTILNVNMTFSIIISAMVAVAYTMMGGLWSVAYTDVVQLVLIVLGLLVAVPSVLVHTGGWDVMWAKYQNMMGATASFFPLPHKNLPENFWQTGFWMWIDAALLLIMGGIPWGVYFQRVMAAKNAQTARRLSYSAAFLCLLLAIPPVVLGVAGKVVDWSQFLGANAQAPQGALILPSVLKYLTPPLVAAMALGAVAAGVMSSVDSSFLSLSTLFVWNIYRPLLRPGARDREYVIVSKLAIAGFAMVATALAITVKSVYSLWFLCSDLVYVILFPQLVMCFYSKYHNRYGAWAGILVGLFLRAGGGEVTLGLAPFLPYPPLGHDGVMYFPFRTTAMLGAMFSIGLVSWLTQKEKLASNEKKIDNNLHQADLLELTTEVTTKELLPNE